MTINLCHGSILGHEAKLASHLLMAEKYLQTAQTFKTTKKRFNIIKSYYEIYHHNIYQQNVQNDQ